MPNRKPWSEPNERLGLPEASDGGPFDGMPAHLLHHMPSWFALAGTYVDLTEIALRVHIAWTPGLYMDDGTSLVTAMEQQAPDDLEIKLIQAIDLCLYSTKLPDRNRIGGPLERFLDLGGSAYRVNAAGDGLERRIDPIATAAYAAATKGVRDGDTSAADHLRAAWKAAYGIQPNASLAYGEAIKAIEAAAIPVLLPNDRTATLGKILGSLKQKPETIVFAIGDGDASAVIGMMRAVWDGHSDRHGSTTTKRVGDEAARAAVHLAVTLVQLFRQGSIRTK